jgi:hypothetical protein
MAVAFSRDRRGRLGVVSVYRPLQVDVRLDRSVFAGEAARSRQTVTFYLNELL